MHKKIVASLVLLALGGCGSAEQAAAPLHLRVMETTDLHANMMNVNYFTGQEDDTLGYVKTATLIRQARSEVANSVLVDNGDLLQGTALGDYIAKVKGLKDGAVHPIYQAMNPMGYDVGNVGNHEFNFGLPFLLDSLHGAAFPYVSANLFKDDGDGNPANDQPLLKQYLIKDYQFRDQAGQPQAVKIGYIGFVPPQILEWDAVNLKGKVTVRDMVDMAKELVPQMKAQGADVIIAIPHAGMTASPRQGMDENAAYYLSQVPGIDALMLGHSHSYFPGERYQDLPNVDMAKGTVNGVAAVMPGFWGNNLGVIDLELTKGEHGWQVTGSQSTLRPIFKREEGKVVSLAKNDATVEAAVAPAHQETTAWVSTPFAKINGDIQSFFALVQDDPAVQVVNNAQRWYLERYIQGTEFDGMAVLSAAAPFRTGYGGAGNYTFVPQGDIAYRNVADLYLYPNTATVVKVKGAVVREWLERSAGLFNQIDPKAKGQQELINSKFASYNFDVIDGVSYQVDLAQPSRYDGNGQLIHPEAHRIQQLTYQGQPLDAEQEFLVITSNYRAGGGGHFPGVDSSAIVIASPDENRQIVADFLGSQKDGYNPAVDNNWQFAPLAGEPLVTFWSAGGDQAKAVAKDSAKVEPTGQTNAEGYAQYRLRF
ncbi:bifunctional 2',3'-cyclic-nucleotide 2'-phosphodiesterase/3'-nucleotidase [Gallaecimonas xiamenensis]|uniref:5'-nucleotidase domain-containing protein n=1 Tax=Gallaecimonas xiamenensis 3-C-1 TaxID=745411 RepID=K2JTL2_9GAMM|nr:bifunctional 2',3'-cyclic-nucleotide 2'-phosphodiesterase/3'-nucleotidase [Gallaecimonas xiamenensis]EKE68505.1 5'-nucleotidase domain-containing protein [Gallaecimonas xiamenensis 3-C-1]